MPRPNPPRLMGSEASLRRRIAYERKLAGWKPAALAHRMTQVGCPINQSGIWKIENANRAISVDELVAFSTVFKLSERELLVPPEVAVDKRARKLAQDYEAAVDAAFEASKDLVQHVNRYPAVEESVEQYLGPLATRVAAAFALQGLDAMRHRFSKLSEEERQRHNESLWAARHDKSED